MHICFSLVMTALLCCGRTLTLSSQSSRFLSGSKPSVATPSRVARSSTSAGVPCRSRQQIGQALLDLVAAGPSTHHHHGACKNLQSTLTVQHSGTRYNSNAASNSTSTAANSTANQSSSRPIEQLHLPNYIHHLPAPVAPSGWWQLCGDIANFGPTGLLGSLAPERKPLPDVQGSAAAHCQLGRQPWAHAFCDTALSAFVAALFLSIVHGRMQLAHQLGAAAPSLDRFDFFHGHIFTAKNYSHNSSDWPAIRLEGSKGTTARDSTTADSSSTQNCGTAINLDQQPPQLSQEQRAKQSQWTGISTSETKATLARQYPPVGVLFHAAEYPAYDNDSFPFMLGRCQANSTLRFQQRSMDLRNILWWQGQLAVLDVGERSPLHDLLLHEGTRPLRTVYEEDFGQPVADLLLLVQGQPRRVRRRKVSAEEARRPHRLLEAARSAARPNSLSSMINEVLVSY
eukprot:GHRR01005972.1.p1 GENE.GHRR01005972.1~~GHRR01005972.1.p1  ORF type:complete len:456 (+),score=150.16 GHRR01005972.1:145-1512(+)